MVLDLFRFADVPVRVGIINNASVLNCAGFDKGFIGCVVNVATAGPEVAA